MMSFKSIQHSWLSLSWRNLASESGLILLTIMGVAATQALMWSLLLGPCAAFKAESFYRTFCPACTGVLGPLMAAEQARSWMTVEEIAACEQQAQTFMGGRDD